MVPWKSSLSYKAGTNSTYSSRDDVTGGESKSRLGLTASPATYRPSFSGGTYRSVKRDAPLVVPLQKNYGSTYSSGSKLEKDEPKPAQSTAKTVPKISMQTPQPSYSGSATSKSYDQNKSRSLNSTGNLLKYDRKSRDPSPAIDRMSSIPASRARSRDPSPLTDRRHNTGTYSSSTSNLSKYGHRSRDPSPATSDLRLGSSVQNRNNLRARSRDPSPSSIQYKNRLGASQNNYSTNYRLNPRSTKNYGSKYSTNTSSSSSNSGMPDKALSYMSVSDFRARSVSRTHDCVKKLEKLSLGDTEKEQKSREEEPKDKIQIEVDESNVEAQEPIEPDTFITVKVVTRGTSPTPPGSTSIVRTRRLELAKTIEKTIQRSSRKPKCVDKAMQSDRLDDTTRYSRFSAASRLSNSNWSSPLSCEPKFSRSESSKHSSTSSNASRSNKNETEAVEKKGKDEPPLQKSSSSSSRGSMKQDKSKDSAESKTSKLTKSSSSAKARSAENSGSSRSLPPTIPKSESSAKSSSSSSGAVRWPNKDFRKSALNVGPTDRPRKSRTPSTSTDTDEKCEAQKSSPGPTRLERSPSVASETGSSTSASSINGQTFTDDKPQIGATKLMKRNNTETANSFGSDVEQNNENSSESWRKSFDTRSEQQTCSTNESNVLEHRQNQSANVYPLAKGESSVQLVAKNEAAKSILIRKLGSISNFFATRTQDESVDETIFLDESGSPSSGNGQGGSISGALKGDSLTTTNSTTAMVSQTQTQSQSYLLNPTAAVTSTTNSDLDESSWWQNTSQQVDTESALDVRDEMKYKLRHIDSGEIAWWLHNENDREPGDNEDDTIADDLKTLNQQNDFDTDPDRSLTNELKRSASRGTSPWWPTTSTRESSCKEKSPFIKPVQSGEKAWWLNESTEESPIENEASQHDDSSFSDVKNKQNAVPVGDGQANLTQGSEPMSRTMAYGGNYVDGGNRYQNQKLTTVKEDSVSQFEVTSPPDSGAGPGYNIPWWMKDSSAEGEKKAALFKVKRIESGERAWWLSDSNDSSSHKNPPPLHAQTQYQSQTELPANPLLLQRNQVHRNIEQSFQLENQPNDSQSDSVFLEDEEVKRASENYYNNYATNTHPYANSPHYQPPPLEHRRSPEGLEDTTQATKSTLYETTNNRNTNYSSNRNNNNVASPSNEFQYGKSDTLFISRHTNIDDLLGGSCRPLSPLLNIFNGESGNGTDDLRMFLEEISPQQVRIHDSTAQMPVIQRMGRDESDYRRPSQTQRMIPSQILNQKRSLHIRQTTLATLGMQPW